MDAKIPIAAIILTYNEEKNIENCLSSIEDLVQEVFVVDSFSTDNTIEICRRYTDKIFQHPFETHAKQWNWSFNNLNLSYEWCMALDADQAISEKLKRELRELFSNRHLDFNGYYINRRQIFRGKWIRFGGYYPKYMLKLFKIKNALCDENELVDYRFYVSGKIGKLKGCIIENNKNEDDITFWLEKHIRFIRLNSEELTRYRQIKGHWKIRPSLWGSYDSRTLWLKDFYYALPLYIRPFLFFIFRYFILLGFLDGANGFLFHFLQGLWYRLMIDIKIAEVKREP